MSEAKSEMQAPEAITTQVRQYLPSNFGRETLEHCALSCEFPKDFDGNSRVAEPECQPQPHNSCASHQVSPGVSSGAEPSNSKRSVHKFRLTFRAVLTVRDNFSVLRGDFPKVALQGMQSPLIMLLSLAGADSLTRPAA